MALFDFLNRSQNTQTIPSLNLPTPTNCGQCSGTTKYNTQLPESGPCDFSGSRPIFPSSSNPFNFPTQQPGYPTSQPQPVSPFSRRPIGPSTVPPPLGQFNPNYLNPANPTIPNVGQPAFPGAGAKYPKPCPRYLNPTPKYPQPIRPTIPYNKPPPNPCLPSGSDTWNNNGSTRQPLIIGCASGNNACPPNPFQPQFRNPDNPPPILRSGKRRDVVTPEDGCIPQNGLPYGGWQPALQMPAPYSQPSYQSQAVFTPF